MKKTFALLVLLVLSVGVFAQEHEEEIAEGKSLVDAKTPCDQLSHEQLEEIGEYIMETMHPGEAHERMHEMMGIEEGTEAHESFHVNIAQRMYCGKSMMGPGMMHGGMMGPGMMGGPGMTQGGQMMGWSGMWTFTSVLWTIILVGLVILVWLWVIKLWRDVFGRKH
jgi:hypothetical protein